MVKRKVRKIILGVTGSIAAYKSCDIIRRLIEKGCKISVVMTSSAEKFITPLTLSSVAGSVVYRGHSLSVNEEYQMPHIRLAEDADVLLIAPATANIISKLACGFADDLLTCLFLSIKAPVWIAPAMNTEMYKHKIIQENCAKLKRQGVKFIDPIKGNLACGVIGEGHLADIDTIVKAVMNL